jgi:hypothetical protein
MPTRHLIGCVIAVVGLASILTLIAPSVGGFAVFAALLLCPLVMVIAMKLIMGGPGESVRQSEPTVDHSRNLTERVGR